jgi:predicted Zn-dependent protease
MFILNANVLLIDHSPLQPGDMSLLLEVALTYKRMKVKEKRRKDRKKQRKKTQTERRKNKSRDERNVGMRDRIEMARNMIPFLSHRKRLSTQTSNVTSSRAETVTITGTIGLQVHQRRSNVMAIIKISCPSIYCFQ